MLLTQIYLNNTKYVYQHLLRIAATVTDQYGPKALAEGSLLAAWWLSQSKDSDIMIRTKWFDCGLTHIFHNTSFTRLQVFSIKVHKLDRNLVLIGVYQH